MRKLSLLIVLALAIMATQAFAQNGPPFRRAQANISVKVDGLNCSNGGTFSVLAWSFGASNTVDTSGGGGGAGKANLSDFNISKKFDDCSPGLFSSVVTGKHFKTLTLTQEDNKKNVVMTVVLSDPIVTSYSLGGTEASAEPSENLSFNFSKICITDSESGNHLCFDVAANKQF